MHTHDDTHRGGEDPTALPKALSEFERVVFADECRFTVWRARTNLAAAYHGHQYATTVSAASLPIFDTAPRERSATKSSAR